MANRRPPSSVGSAGPSRTGLRSWRTPSAHRDGPTPRPAWCSSLPGQTSPSRRTRRRSPMARGQGRVRVRCTGRPGRRVPNDPSRLVGARRPSSDPGKGVTRALEGAGGDAPVWRLTRAPDPEEGDPDDDAGPDQRGATRPSRPGPSRWRGCHVRSSSWRRRPDHWTRRLRRSRWPAGRPAWFGPADSSIPSRARPSPCVSVTVPATRDLTGHAVEFDDLVVVGATHPARPGHDVHGCSTFSLRAPCPPPRRSGPGRARLVSGKTLLLGVPPMRRDPTNVDTEKGSSVTLVRRSTVGRAQEV